MGNVNSSRPPSKPRMWTTGSLDAADVRQRATGVYTVDAQPVEHLGFIARVAYAIAPATSGLWSAVQGMVLSFAFVLLTALVAILDAPASTVDGVPWTDAGGVAGGLWLLAHGVGVPFAYATATLIPLGISAIALFTTYMAAKRSSIVSVAAVVTGAVAYGLVVAVAAGLAGLGLGAGLAGFAGGALVAGLGVTAGVLSNPDCPPLADLCDRLLWRVPYAIRHGLRGGAIAVVAVMALAGLTTAAWLLVNRESPGQMLDVLQPGWIGGGVLALAQLALVPNIVAWAGAWLVGPGFVVGQGSLFVAGGVGGQPVPALPVLGALPGAVPQWASSLYTAGADAYGSYGAAADNPALYYDPASPYYGLPGSGLAGASGASVADASAATGLWPTVAQWLPVLVVACGLLAAVYVWSRRVEALPHWLDVGLTAVCLPLTAGVGMAAIQWLAAGAVGADMLSMVGANALSVGLWTAVWVFLGSTPLLAALRWLAASRQADAGS